MSLADLKRLARHANFESGWQHIGAEHKAELGCAGLCFAFPTRLRRCFSLKVPDCNLRQGARHLKGTYKGDLFTFFFDFGSMFGDLLGFLSQNCVF